MKPRISVVTLGVNNLEKSVEFYRAGLGLSTEGIIGKEGLDQASNFLKRA